MGEDHVESVAEVESVVQEHVEKQGSDPADGVFDSCGSNKVEQQDVGAGDEAGDTVVEGNDDVSPTDSLIEDAGGSTTEETIATREDGETHASRGKEADQAVHDQVNEVEEDVNHGDGSPQDVHDDADDEVGEISEEVGQASTSANDENVSLDETADQDVSSEAGGPGEEELKAGSEPTEAVEVPVEKLLETGEQQLPEGVTEDKKSLGVDESGSAAVGSGAINGDQQNENADVSEEVQDTSTEDKADETTTDNNRDIVMGGAVDGDTSGGEQAENAEKEDSRVIADEVSDENDVSNDKPGEFVTDEVDDEQEPIQVSENSGEDQKNGTEDRGIEIPSGEEAGHSFASADAASGGEMSEDVSSANEAASLEGAAEDAPVVNPELSSGDHEEQADEEDVETTEAPVASATSEEDEKPPEAAEELLPLSDQSSLDEKFNTQTVDGRAEIQKATTTTTREIEQGSDGAMVEEASNSKELEEKNTSILVSEAGDAGGVVDERKNADERSFVGTPDNSSGESLLLAAAEGGDQNNQSDQSEEEAKDLVGDDNQEKVIGEEDVRSSAAEEPYEEVLDENSTKEGLVSKSHAGGELDNESTGEEPREQDVEPVEEIITSTPEAVEENQVDTNTTQNDPGEAGDDSLLLQSGEAEVDAQKESQVCEEPEGESAGAVQADHQDAEEAGNHVEKEDGQILDSQAEESALKQESAGEASPQASEKTESDDNPQIEEVLDSVEDQDLARESPEISEKSKEEEGDEISQTQVADEVIPVARESGESQACEEPDAEEAAAVVDDQQDVEQTEDQSGNSTEAGGEEAAAGEDVLPQEDNKEEDDVVDENGEPKVDNVLDNNLDATEKRAEGDPDAAEQFIETKTEAHGDAPENAEVLDLVEEQEVTEIAEDPKEEQVARDVVMLNEDDGSGEVTVIAPESGAEKETGRDIQASEEPETGASAAVQNEASDEQQDVERVEDQVQTEQQQIQAGNPSEEEEAAVQSSGKEISPQGDDNKDAAADGEPKADIDDVDLDETKERASEGDSAQQFIQTESGDAPDAEGALEPEEQKSRETENADESKVLEEDAAGDAILQNQGIADEEVTTITPESKGEEEVEGESQACEEETEEQQIQAGDSSQAVGDEAVVQSSGEEISPQEEDNKDDAADGTEKPAEGDPETAQDVTQREIEDAPENGGVLGSVEEQVARETENAKESEEEVAGDAMLHNEAFENTHEGGADEETEGEIAGEESAADAQEVDSASLSSADQTGATHILDSEDINLRNEADGGSPATEEEALEGADELSASLPEESSEMKPAYEHGDLQAEIQVETTEAAGDDVGEAEKLEHGVETELEGAEHTENLAPSFVVQKSDGSSDHQQEQEKGIDASGEPEVNQAAVEERDVHGANDVETIQPKENGSKLELHGVEAEENHQKMKQEPDNGITPSAFNRIVSAAKNVAKATKPSKKKRLRLKKELAKLQAVST